LMKDVKFTIIGLSEEYYDNLSKLNLPNVTLLKKISYDELILEYCRAKVFAQISMFEGMPSTLCEAMLCECIPVGSNVNGIPKIIGETGFIVNKRDLNELISQLYEALNSTEDRGLKSREHIVSNFSLKRRREILLETLDRI
jgi:glycosyltransferase involved in cell wall biosynthesis